jgi:hypothetical protein
MKSLRSTENALRDDGTNPLGQRQQSDRMKYIGISLGMTWGLSWHFYFVYFRSIVTAWSGGGVKMNKRWRRAIEHKSECVAYHVTCINVGKRVVLEGENVKKEYAPIPKRKWNTRYGEGFTLCMEVFRLQNYHITDGTQILYGLCC